MTMARWQKPVTDTAGNFLENASIEVRREVTGTPLARIYSDREGTTPKANPFTAATIDDCFFHAVGGAYRVKGSKVVGSTLYEVTYRYQGVGTYQEADQGALNDPGYLYEFEAETTAPPTTGFFRLDNIDASLATEMYVSTTTRGGIEVAERLLELDPGASTRKNALLASSQDVGGATWLIDSATDHTTYVTLALSSHTGDDTFLTSLYSLQRELTGPTGPAIDPGDTIPESGAFTYDPNVHTYSMVLLDTPTQVDVTLPKDSVQGAGFQLTQIGVGKAHFVAEVGGVLRSDLNHARSLKQWSVCGAFVESNVGGNAANWVLFGSTGQ